MLKVDLIYMNGLNEPNGLSSLVRKIDEAHEEFERNGIEQRITSTACYNLDVKNNINTTCPSTTPLKRIVRFISQYSLLFTWFRFYRSFVKPSNKIVDYYETLGDKGDVVVFHEIFSCYAYLRKHIEKKQKVILTIHGNGEFWTMMYSGLPMFRCFLFSPYRKKIERTILKGCDKIGFDSDIPRKNFCKKYYIDEKMTFFAYNGIDVRPYPQRKLPKKLVIVCLASLNERKNQEGIINAIGLLPNNCKDKTELILVGDGSIRKKLEDLAKKLSIHVRFTGTASEEEYNKYLLEANCFCLFSKDEGLPIAVIEGMRAGLPVIGSRVAGIPEEIIDGKTGFLVDVDEVELSERIKFFVDNLPVLEKMGRESYNYFLEKFTTEAMVKKFTKVYNS